MTGRLPNMKNYSFMQLLFQLQWLPCYQINICPARRILFSLCFLNGAQAKVSRCSWLSYTVASKHNSTGLTFFERKEKCENQEDRMILFQQVTQEISLSKKQPQYFFLLKDKLVPHSLCTTILIFLQLCRQPHISATCVSNQPGTLIVATSPTSNACHEAGHINSNLELHTVRRVPD